jgi:hypothetical protein
MKRARPDELTEEAVPVLEARLPEKTVRRLIPVELSRVDPLAEAEPSVGALLRLDAGLLAVAIYGRETGILSLRLPRFKVSAGSLRSILEEIPIPDGAIFWTSPETRGYDSAPSRAVGGVGR